METENAGDFRERAVQETTPDAAWFLGRSPSIMPETPRHFNGDPWTAHKVQGPGSMERAQLAAAGISLSVDLSVGHLSDLAVEDGSRLLRPLHRAPWADEPPESFAEATPPNVARLSGDFFCAPFSRNDVEEAPPHGWPANSAWDLVDERRVEGGHQARFVLRRKPFGATVEKRLTLRDGHPFVYQEHVLSGGRGELPVAHHTMTRMADGGVLAFSPKRAAVTPSSPLEPDPARGRSILAYPARSDGPAHFPLAAGGSADLRRYPPGERHEDFVTLVEADPSGIGYTTCSRLAERDALLVLKPAAMLPVTMLWFSNGGRGYAPWSGRHVGVLGIEDGCSASGHRQSLGDNPIRREGVPTTIALDPGGEVRIRQVIGAAALAGDANVAGLKVEPQLLTLLLDDGTTIARPFDGAFLQDYR